jgi:hypothetical protein
MIYWYYMYYQLNLAGKIIMIITICSFIVAIIVTIKGIILINQCNKKNKYYRNITTFPYVQAAFGGVVKSSSLHSCTEGTHGKAKNRNQKKGE